ncbi:hypothetical protein ACJJTC_016740 [Scirpophaga incertulas]
MRGGSRPPRGGSGRLGAESAGGCRRCCSAGCCCTTGRARRARGTGAAAGGTVWAMRGAAGRLVASAGDGRCRGRHCVGYEGGSRPPRGGSGRLGAESAGGCRRCCSAGCCCTTGRARRARGTGAAAGGTVWAMRGAAGRLVAAVLQRGVLLYYGSRAQSAGDGRCRGRHCVGYEGGSRPPRGGSGRLGAESAGGCRRCCSAGCCCTTGRARRARGTGAAAGGTAVLQRGVLLYYGSRAQSAGDGRCRGRHYLDGASVSAPAADSAGLLLRLSDGDVHRLGVRGTTPSRQAWITAFTDHIAYSGHYLWAGASPDTAREATEEVDDECKPLGSMQDALTAATNSLALLETQLRECSAIVAALDKTVNVGTSLHHSAYMRFQHACGTGSEALTALKHCAALVAQARDHDANRLQREIERNRVLEEALAALARTHHALEMSVAEELSKSKRKKSSTPNDSKENFFDVFEGSDDEDDTLVTAGLSSPLGALSPWGSSPDLMRHTPIGSHSDGDVTPTNDELRSQLSESGSPRSLHTALSPASSMGTLVSQGGHVYRNARPYRRSGPLRYRTVPHRTASSMGTLVSQGGHVYRNARPYRRSGPLRYRTVPHRTASSMGTLVSQGGHVYRNARPYRRSGPLRYRTVPHRTASSMGTLVSQGGHVYRNARPYRRSGPLRYRTVPHRTASSMGNAGVAGRPRVPQRAPVPPLRPAQVPHRTAPYRQLHGPRWCSRAATCTANARPYRRSGPLRYRTVPHRTASSMGTLVSQGGHVYRNARPYRRSGPLRAATCTATRARTAAPARSGTAPYRTVPPSSMGTLVSQGGHVYRNARPYRRSGPLRYRTVPHRTASSMGTLVSQGGHVYRNARPYRRSGPLRYRTVPHRTASSMGTLVSQGGHVYRNARPYRRSGPLRYRTVPHRTCQLHGHAGVAGRPRVPQRAPVPPLRPAQVPHRTAPYRQLHAARWCRRAATCTATRARTAAPARSGTAPYRTVPPAPWARWCRRAGHVYRKRAPVPPLRPAQVPHRTAPYRQLHGHAGVAGRPRVPQRAPVPPAPGPLRYRTRTAPYRQLHGHAGVAGRPRVPQRAPVPPHPARSGTAPYRTVPPAPWHAGVAGRPRVPQRAPLPPPPARSGTAPYRTVPPSSMGTLVSQGGHVYRNARPYPPLRPAQVPHRTAPYPPAPWARWCRRAATCTATRARNRRSGPLRYRTVPHRTASSMGTLVSQGGHVYRNARPYRRSGPLRYRTVPHRNASPKRLLAFWKDFFI